MRHCRRRRVPNVVRDVGPKRVRLERDRLHAAGRKRSWRREVSESVLMGRREEDRIAPAAVGRLAVLVEAPGRGLERDRVVRIKQVLDRHRRRVGRPNPLVVLAAAVKLVLCCLVLVVPQEPVVRARRAAEGGQPTCARGQQAAGNAPNGRRHVGQELGLVELPGRRLARHGPEANLGLGVVGARELDEVGVDRLVRQLETVHERGIRVAEVEDPVEEAEVVGRRIEVVELLRKVVATKQRTPILEVVILGRAELVAAVALPGRRRRHRLPAKEVVLMECRRGT
jgi:hypothetical protein